MRSPARPSLDGADDRHRPADGCFESQLTSLARRERPERRAVVRNHLLVGGDHRLAGFQRAPNPVGRRVEAADRFDDDVDVALQDFVETRWSRRRARRPDWRRLRSARRSTMCVSSRLRDSVAAGQTPGDGRTDGAEAQAERSVARV